MISKCFKDRIVIDGFRWRPGDGASKKERSPSTSVPPQPLQEKDLLKESKCDERKKKKSRSMRMLSTSPQISKHKDS